MEQADWRDGTPVVHFVPEQRSEEPAPRIALEAGVTPSPELVASAGPQSGLRLRAGVPLLVALAIGVVIIAATIPRVRLINRVPLDDPPAVLAAKARAFLREVTGDAPRAYQIFRLQSHAAYLEYVTRARDPRVDPAQVAQLIKGLHGKSRIRKMADGGFQDHRHRPLGHPSASSFLFGN